MSRGRAAAKVVYRLGEVALFGTLSLAPERIPFLLTNEKVEARLMALEERTHTFRTSMRTLNEEIRRLNCPSENRSPHTGGRHHGRTNTSPRLTQICQLKNQKKAELQELRGRMHTEICSETVLAGRGRRLELGIVDDTFVVPNNTAQLCGIRSVTITSFVPPHILQIVFGVFALIGVYHLINGVMELFQKDSNNRSRADSE